MGSRATYVLLGIVGFLILLQVLKRSAVNLLGKLSGVRLESEIETGRYRDGDKKS